MSMNTTAVAFMQVITEEFSENLGDTAESDIAIGALVALPHVAGGDQQAANALTRARFKII